MNTGKRICGTGALAMLFLCIAAQDADAQYRARYRGSYSTGIKSYPGGAYRGTTTIRSFSRSPGYGVHGPAYTTIYFTNRAPIYRYSAGHPLSQATLYSRSPYPRATYRTPPVIQYYRPPSYYRVPQRRPGVTIGIQF